MPVSVKDEIRANRLKWLEALESGKHTQIVGELCTREFVDGSWHTAGHCCLGIGCEVVLPAGHWDGSTWLIPTPTVLDGFIDADGTYDDIGGSDSLVGAKNPLMRALRMSEASRLSCLSWNDNGVPFAVIAQFMRRRWRLPKETTP